MQYNIATVSEYGANVNKKIQELEEKKRKELSLKYPNTEWVARCDKILAQLRQDLINHIR